MDKPKFKHWEKIKFRWKMDGKSLDIPGVIMTVDYGGSLEMLGKCHSYDALADSGWLDEKRVGEFAIYKHIPEADVFPISEEEAAAIEKTSWFAQMEETHLLKRLNTKKME